MNAILKFPSPRISIPTNGESRDQTAHDAVVLLHGLFATRKSMADAQDKLNRSGYVTVNWGYPSFIYKIHKFTQPLLTLLKDMDADEHIRSISFVTHSFGAIVTRYVLDQVCLRKVWRAVMMAPPNAGSSLTKIRLGPFRYLCPTIADISLESDSLANRLGSPKAVEVGVIAAQRDFVVPLSNTHLPSQADHCVVESTHFSLPTNQDALSKSLNFLRFGNFSGQSSNSQARAA